MPFLFLSMKLPIHIGGQPFFIMHRREPQFSLQTVHSFRSAPLRLPFFVSGGVFSSFCTAANRFFLYRRCFFKFLHRRKLYFSSQAVFPLLFVPPRVTFFVSSGTSPCFCTAANCIFLLRRCLLYGVAGHFYFSTRKSTQRFTGPEAFPLFHP